MYITIEIDSDMKTWLENHAREPWLEFLQLVHGAAVRATLRGNIHIKVEPYNKSDTVNYKSIVVICEGLESERLTEIRSYELEGQIKDALVNLISAYPYQASHDVVLRWN